MNNDPFLTTLQKMAKEQARIAETSPLPEWVKPLAAVIGLHYWQVLLVVSCAVAVLLSIASFASVYSQVMGS